MRKLMETHAIGKLCDALTADDLRALEEYVKQMRAASNRGNAAQFVAGDEGFHLVSISRCDNFFLATLVKNIRDFIFIFGRSVVERQAAMQEVVAEHEQILKALKVGDRARAAAAMATHLENTEKRLLRSQAE
jgi:DNA-binding GntR family transcriptional regulator